MCRLLPTNQIWRYHSFERFCSDVQQLGLSDVDLWLCNNHVNVDAHEAYNAREVLELCRRHGIKVRTLTPEQSNPKAYNVASTAPDIRRLTRGYYRQIVRLGAALGARRISMNGGWFPLDVDRDRSWDALAGMLGEICDMAASEGLEVSVETLTRRPYRLVTGLGDVGRLMEEVDRGNLFATLDTGTIARNGEDAGEYLRALSGRVGYVHLTNMSPSVFAHLAWGDGEGALDARQTTECLRAGGYRGDCALEMTRSSYWEHPQEILARSVRTLKGCEG